MPISDKEKLKRDRLKFRSQVSGKPLEKKKSKKTGELELFKKIALDRSYSTGSQYEGMRYVIAKHIEKDGKETTKTIFLEDLTPTNFSHKIPKSRGEQYRLDPDNIEIVSLAWHFYEHNKQVIQIDYPN